MHNLTSQGRIDPDFISAAEKKTLISKEIRIQQSVEIQKFIPLTVLANVSIAVVLFFVDPGLIISSGAFIGYILTAAVHTSGLLSYLRLRHNQRPENVSPRRIRTIIIGASLSGAAWAIFSLLALRHADQVTALTFALGTTAFALTSLVAMASTPVAATMCCLLILTANCFAIAAFGHLPIWLSVLIFGTLGAIAIGSASANWQKTRANVLQQVENTLAEKKRGKDMEILSRRLAKYLSPQLSNSILTREQTDSIVAKRKKLTIFFSDIVGFTEIADRLESEELSALLNRYLTEMSLIAEEHGGTVDKFIGDAVVVYFGDPESKGVQEDAAACVRMAVAMQDRVRELKQEWLELGLEDTFDLRVGINTGYCTVGNFGSEMRMDYTIIGREVNLAARLETAAEVGGILLANETYALVKEWVSADEGELLTVKGVSRPVRTFNLKSFTKDGKLRTQGFRRNEAHLSLTMNRGLMTDAERNRSAAVLREALENIEGRA